MTKLLIGLLGAGVLATGGWAAASGLDDAEPVRTVSLPAATTGDDTTATTTSANEVEDVSGPCDEAEHAGDPRCSRPGGGDHDEDDDHDDDRSGSNSGRG